MAGGSKATAGSDGETGELEVAPVEEEAGEGVAPPVHPLPDCGQGGHQWVQVPGWPSPEAATDREKRREAGLIESWPQSSDSGAGGP